MSRWPKNWKIIEIPEHYFWLTGITAGVMIAIASAGWLSMFQIINAQQAHIVEQAAIIAELREQETVKEVRLEREPDSEGVLMLAGPEMYDQDTTVH